MKLLGTVLLSLLFVLNGAIILGALAVISYTAIWFGTTAFANWLWPGSDFGGGWALLGFLMGLERVTIFGAFNGALQFLFVRIECRHLSLWLRLWGVLLKRFILLSSAAAVTGCLVGLSIFGISHILRSGGHQQLQQWSDSLTGPDILWMMDYMVYGAGIGLLVGSTCGVLRVIKRCK